MPHHQRRRGKCPVVRWPVPQVAPARQIRTGTYKYSTVYVQDTCSITKPGTLVKNVANAGVRGRKKYDSFYTWEVGVGNTLYQNSNASLKPTSCWIAIRGGSRGHQRSIRVLKKKNDTTRNKVYAAAVRCTEANAEQTLSQVAAQGSNTGHLYAHKICEVRWRGPDS